MFLMLINTVVNCVLGGIAAEGEAYQLCVGPPQIQEHACLTPYSYFVIWLTVVILLAMVNDVAPDLILMFATIIMSILPGPCGEGQEGPTCYLISAREALQGFSAPAILAAATLLVYARCLEETKAVERMITPCLAGAKSDVSAVMRLAFPTFFFSSFLNSTPIVAMLIPVCEAWCARSGFKLQVVLMPLSFSAMLGGLTSLVGTASNMVLNAQIEADDNPPIYPFGFFTQAPAGVPAAVAGLVVLSFLAPVLLGNLGGAEQGAGEGDALPAPSQMSARLRVGGSTVITDTDVHLQRGYELEVLVMDGCPLVGQTVKELFEIVVNSRTSANPYRDVHSTSAISATGSTNNAVAPLKVSWITRKDGTRREAAALGFDTLKLEVGDQLGLSLAATVVPALRRVKGLKAAAELASDAYKHHPKGRALFELALSQHSDLVGLDTATAASHRDLQYSVLWAVRTSPLEQGIGLLSLGSTKRSTKRAGAMSGKMLDAAAGGSSSSAASGLQAGDFLLVEADDDFGEAHKSDKSYALITLVPGSVRAPTSEDAAASTKPEWLEQFQFWMSILSLVLMVVVSITGLIPILPLSFLLMFSLISIGCITPEQAWLSIKYRVILTIMAAFGLGDALDNTDVADIIAAALVSTGEVVGPWFFLVIVFMVTALLSFLVGSTPAIILLYASVRLTSNVPGLKISQSLMALMLGAVCALATPVGFATNLMVQARAGYGFGDFFVLGSVVTATICLVSCSIILILPDSLLPEVVTNTTSEIPGMSGDDPVHHERFNPYAVSYLL